MQDFKTALHDSCVSLRRLADLGFVSTVLTESGTLFTGAESISSRIRLRIRSTLCFIWSKVIIFAHNFVIYFGVLLYFQLWREARAFMQFRIPAGDVQWCADQHLSSHALRAVSRYSAIVASIVQIVFFLTPIMWKPNSWSARRADDIQSFSPVEWSAHRCRAHAVGCDYCLI